MSRMTIQGTGTFDGRPSQNTSDCRYQTKRKHHDDDVGPGISNRHDVPSLSSSSRSRRHEDDRFANHPTSPSTGWSSYAPPPRRILSTEQQQNATVVNVRENSFAEGSFGSSDQHYTWYQHDLSHPQQQHVQHLEHQQPQQQTPPQRRGVDHDDDAMAWNSYAPPPRRKLSVQQRTGSATEETNKQQNGEENSFARRGSSLYQHYPWYYDDVEQEQRLEKQREKENRDKTSTLAHASYAPPQRLLSPQPQHRNYDETTESEDASLARRGSSLYQHYPWYQEEQEQKQQARRQPQQQQDQPSHVTRMTTTTTRNTIGSSTRQIVHPPNLVSGSMAIPTVMEETVLSSTPSARPFSPPTTIYPGAERIRGPTYRPPTVSENDTILVEYGEQNDHDEEGARGLLELRAIASVTKPPLVLRPSTDPVARPVAVDENVQKNVENETITCREEDDSQTASMNQSSHRSECERNGGSSSAAAAGGDVESFGGPHCATSSSNNHGSSNNATAKRRKRQRDIRRFRRCAFGFCVTLVVLVGIVIGVTVGVLIGRGAGRRIGSRHDDEDNSNLAPIMTPSPSGVDETRSPGPSSLSPSSIIVEKGSPSPTFTRSSVPSVVPSSRPTPSAVTICSNCPT